MRQTLGDLPLDPLLRLLLDDLGCELPRDPPDLGLELDVLVVLLGHGLESVHELRPLLELRPLFVDGAHRDADVDVPLEWHAPALADSGYALLLLALAATTGQQALARFLGDPADAAGLLDLVIDGTLDLVTDLVTDLPSGLLHGTFGVPAADPAHELPGALRGERNERGNPHAGGQSLGSRERAIHALTNRVGHPLDDVPVGALARVRGNVLRCFASSTSDCGAEHVGYILGHLSLLLFPLSLNWRYPSETRGNRQILRLEHSSGLV